MSWSAQKRVRKHSPVKGTPKKVLVELALAGDDEGRGAFLSASQLARAIGSHRNTVDRALAKLEEQGYIVRHRGGRSHCSACKRAQRRVRVFDVVMPPASEEVNPGQIGLFESHHSPPVELHQVVQSSEPVLHHHGASTCTTVVQLEDLRREGQQQRQDAREFPNEMVATVERVVAALSPTRLFVDRYAIEAVVMHSTPAAVDSALPEVIALASDPAYRLPKGGAAKMLRAELARQSSRPVSVFGPRRAPASAPGAPDEFAKYNVAAGLA